MDSMKRLGLGDKGAILLWGIVHLVSMAAAGWPLWPPRGNLLIGSSSRRMREDQRVYKFAFFYGDLLRYSATREALVL